MSSLNKVQIIGRLGADPELSYTKSGLAALTLSIATSDRYKDAEGQWRDVTDWHRVAFYGKRAEAIARNLSKGSQVYVEGKLKTTRVGEKSYTRVYGQVITFLGSKVQRSVDYQGPEFDPGETDEIPF